MTDYDEIDQMLSHLRGRGDKLCSDAADEIERLRAALEGIAAIEDEYYGDDWDEINKAREIASAALNIQQSTGKCDV